MEHALIDYWLEPANASQLVAAVRSAGYRRVTVDLRGFWLAQVLEGVVAG